MERFPCGILSLVIVGTAVPCTLAVTVGPGDAGVPLPATTLAENPQFAGTLDRSFASDAGLGNVRLVSQIYRSADDMAIFAYGISSCESFYVGTLKLGAFIPGNDAFDVAHLPEFSPITPNPFDALVISRPLSLVPYNGEIYSVYDTLVIDYGNAATASSGFNAPIFVKTTLPWATYEAMEGSFLNRATLESDNGTLEFDILGLPPPVFAPPPPDPDPDGDGTSAPPPIPEPLSLGLLPMALGALYLFRRR